jgi:hypothetical protein
MKQIDGSERSESADDRGKTDKAKVVRVDDAIVDG